jgi:hypothetical protein
MTVKCCMRRWLLYVWQHQRRPRLPHPPLTDYSVAVARAIAWLGDRYLLARPVKAALYQPVPYWLYCSTSDGQAQTDHQRELRIPMD